MPLPDLQMMASELMQPSPSMFSAQPYADALRYASSLPPSQSAPDFLDTQSGSFGERFLTALAQEPGRIASGIASAVTLPHDVYAGTADPNSPPGFARAMGLAGMLAMPLESLGNPADIGGLEAANSLAGRSPRMYNPPEVAPRPFEADYPAGAPSDASGRLTADIEGRPLGAQYIAGRNMVGAGEETISPAGANAIAEATTGKGPQAVAPGQIGGDAGRLVRSINPVTGQPEFNIFLGRNLDEASANKVLAHEVGHALDEISGQVPTQGLDTELRSVYNTLNNPQNYGKPFGPEQNGYKGANVQRELVAESIRAYMNNPNYLKSVAPKTAAAIRSAVNAHPTLSPIIQFNASGLPIPSGNNSQ